MHREYAVVWYDGNRNRLTVVKVAHPPHNPPEGSDLEDLLTEGIEAQHVGHDGVIIQGAVELCPAAWTASGAVRSAVVEGQVASLECTAEGWRAHA